MDGSSRTRLAVCALVLASALPAAARERSRDAAAPATETLLLTGADKDHTVDWEFQCTSGRRSGTWTRIPTPSNWELQGFGTYTWGSRMAPEEKGLYRRTFTPPARWRQRRVFLVFEGSMTDTEVKLNGRPAGPVHRGGFYRFQHEVTELLLPGKPNVLEATVSKDSSDESVNRAERQGDYWNFGGIYRPVYLKAVPREFVERLAIDARADGTLAVDVHVGGLATADRVVGQVRGLDGRPVGAEFSQPIASAAAGVRLLASLHRPALWTAETPNLHELEIRLCRGARVLHRVRERFGFRTVEVRPRDGIYVNGRRIRLKGTNRHSFWPDSGRTTSAALSRADVLLMKEMNMNAAVMSHYPPDTHFLDAADELGLYVIDELAGWQKAYDEAAGAPLLEGMVERDVNHPSILFWANGNEGGWNTALDDDFARHDPQRRRVLHPWALSGDVNTDHYETYESTAKILGGPEIYMPTEFLHGLYDGGAGAGLEDYWKLMTSRPLSAGGFIWALADEGIVRGDRDGAIDVSGNLAPDGIVGPYRQREGSFFTVRDVWSPIQLEERGARPSDLPAGFAGRLRISNGYDFTDASRCRFTWKLLSFPGPLARTRKTAVLARGPAASPAIAPGSSGDLDLRLPPGWRDADALAVTAHDPAGRLIQDWVFTIRKAADHRDRILAAAPAPAAAAPVATAVEDATSVTMTANGTDVRIDKASGRLASVRHGGAARSLTNGPAPAAGTASLRSLRHGREGTAWSLEADYVGDLSRVRWTLHASGWLQLDYEYHLEGDHDFLGISFDLPESKVSGVTWLGQGPYRVWKNRMRGGVMGTWSKERNDTATGASLWQYPEFKGCHANTYWAVLHTSEGEITLVSAGEDLFLRLFTPRAGEDPRFATAAFPAGDVSLLDAIPPIGNKFHKAEETGPAGRRNVATGTYRRTVYLDFAGDRR